MFYDTTNICMWRFAYSNLVKLIWILIKDQDWIITSVLRESWKPKSKS